MKNKKHGENSKWPLIILAIIAFVVIITGGLLVALHRNKPTRGLIKTSGGETKTVTSNPSSAGITSSNSPDNQKISTSSQVPTTGELIAPYGGLVSDHRPGQNGSGMTEVSQCVTTPGARCYIKFEQNSVTKMLPEKTAGSDGSVFWEWKVNDAGLTSGKWTISAVATLNGQTRTTTDQLNLEVK